LEVLDILAQKIIFVTNEVEKGDFGGAQIGVWMDGDSFLILGYGRKSAVAIILPLIDDRNIFSRELSCNACEAFGEISLRVDVDQLTIQAAAVELYQSSLVEVTDPAWLIDLSDKHQLDEDTGKSLRRPRFPIKSFNSNGRIYDRLTGNPNKKKPEETEWLFSDPVAIAFFDVSFGDVNKKAAILNSKFYAPTISHAQPATVPAVHGRSIHRMVEVAGSLVSPRSFSEQIGEALSNFGVEVTLPYTPEAKRPDPSDGDYEKRTDSGVLILHEIKADASAGRHSPEHDDDADADETDLLLNNVFMKTYRYFSACDYHDKPWEKQDIEAPVAISANLLEASWGFDLADGSLFVVQQSDYCGTAPSLYGDVISVFIPTDKNIPIKFNRLAASASSGGAVFSPTGIDEARSSVGASLRLDVTPSLAVSVIDGAYLVIASRDSGGAAIYDLRDMKLLQRFDNLENPLDISFLTLTKNHRVLVQVNQGGALSLFSLSRRETLLKGRYVDNETVLFDNELQFEATPEGAAYVYVRVPGAPELYSLDQFAGKLLRPGLARRRIDESSPINLIGEEVRPPPNLTVENLSNAYIVSAQSEAELSKLYIFVDGQTVQNVELHGKTITQAISANSLPKGRWVNFVVEDKQGLKSAVRGFLIGNQRYVGKLNVVTLGADEFRHASYMSHEIVNLLFARSDAARFEQNVRLYLSPFYSSYSTTGLVGEKSSAEELVRAISNAAKNNSDEDTLILFFASHGAVSNGGFSILLPPATQNSQAEEVPFERISSAIGHTRGRVIVFLDTCHSADAAQDYGPEKLASTGGNITIIAASKGRQSSLENASWGGGIFTTAIVDELQKLSRTQGPDRGPMTLTIGRLYANIRKTVTAQTKGEQTPWLRRSSWRGEQSIN
jgi:hypothetical protein